MRSIEEVREVVALVEQGLNDCEISRRTGIPRSTVRDWRHGRVPRRGPLSGRLWTEHSCPECGHPAHDFNALPTGDYAYLLGLYLGDGHITTHARRVYRLGITLDRRYPGIVRECEAAMGSVMPSSKVGVQRLRHMRADFVYSYSRAWVCLFPQHGPGVKHQRAITLTDWQQEVTEVQSEKLLRGLIHSDGCHSVNTIKHAKRVYVYPRYLFSNRSDDIRRIFSDACDRLGIEWRVMTKYDISIAHRESIAMMDEFVGPKE
jgi:Homeodomain-like domain